MTTRASLVLALFAALAAAGPDPAPEPGIVGFHVEPLAVLSARQKADLGVTGDRGVVVAAIVEKGPADVAGLKLGDRLLRFGGNDVPDLVTGADEARHLWRVATRMMLGNARSGETIRVVVARDGQERTLPLLAVSAAEMHRLQADEAWTELPALADAGPPEPLLIDFQGLPEGTLVPAKLHPYEGRWRVLRDPEGAGVLRQDRMILPWAVALAAGKGCCYRDGKATVRFMPLSGIADASGGIIFRAQDPLNYYLVRPNALEDNFRVYVMKDGVRTQLATVTVTPPERNTWHVIEVEFKGPVFRAKLDGRDVVEARDETFASGWCGLWTKADSASLFDDLRVDPE
ncbi:MAG TPA: PDZ domain-containing protein [Planctomycetota bacterium]|nr:PDZ domain-containing protein [Planctomycetota bacterium]